MPKNKKIKSNTKQPLIKKTSKNDTHDKIKSLQKDLIKKTKKHPSSNTLKVSAKQSTDTDKINKKAKKILDNMPSSVAGLKKQCSQLLENSCDDANKVVNKIDKALKNSEKELADAIADLKEAYAILHKTVTNEAHTVLDDSDQEKIKQYQKKAKTTLEKYKNILSSSKDISDEKLTYHADKLKALAVIDNSIKDLFDAAKIIDDIKKHFSDDEIHFVKGNILNKKAVLQRATALQQKKFSTAMQDLEKLNSTLTAKANNLEPFSASEKALAKKYSIAATSLLESYAHVVYLTGDDDQIEQLENVIDHFNDINSAIYDVVHTEDNIRDLHSFVSNNFSRDIDFSTVKKICNLSQFVDLLRYHLHKLKRSDHLHNIENVKQRASTTEDLPPLQTFIPSTHKTKIDKFVEQDILSGRLHAGKAYSKSYSKKLAKLHAEVDSFILKFIGNHTRESLLNMIDEKYYSETRKTQKRYNRTDKEIHAFIKACKNGGIDPVIGLRRLRKIVKEKFIPPKSAGECFMFTAVSMIMANPALEKNYNALQKRLRDSGKIREFNNKMEEVFKTFSSNAIRQRKHVPFKLQNWIMANKEAVATVILKEMAQKLPQKMAKNDSLQDSMRKYNSLFLHSRILRNITRIKEDFDMGGKANVQFNRFLKLIPNADIKPIDKLSPSALPRHVLIHLRKEFNRVEAEGEAALKDYYFSHIPFTSKNIFLNNANSKFIYNPRTKQFDTEQNIAQKLQKGADEEFYQDLLSGPMYKLDTLSISQPGHATSYKHDLKNDTWYSYDINSPDMKTALETTFDAKRKAFSIINEDNISTWVNKGSPSARQGPDYKIEAIIMTRVA